MFVEQNVIDKWEIIEHQQTYIIEPYPIIYPPYNPYSPITYTYTVESTSGLSTKYTSC